MKKFFAIFSLACVCSAYSQIEPLTKSSDKAQQLFDAQRNNQKEKGISLSRYVDPLIGTGGHGHTYPGVSYPFGMMQLSPDTRYEGWDGCSGYHYSDSVIYGFSHTHLSGTGVPDYGDLLIVPQYGDNAKTTPAYIDQKNGYGHAFKHENEKARAGQYDVLLHEDSIKVRLTTTKRAGLHEYIFQKNGKKVFILLDLDHRDKVLEAAFKVHNKTEISGHRISHAWASEQHFYFHLNLSVPYEKAEVINVNGTHKLLLEFPSKTKRVAIRIGMSGVDVNGAKNNLETEIPDFVFQKYSAANVNAWNNELSKIEFNTNDKEIKTIFYTALYHSLLQPNIWSDIDGRYRGRDNLIHKLSSEDEQYTVFSLWDTYRATHPLYTLIQHEKTAHFLKTFMRQYDEGGDLPVWELAANETECMIGYHSVSVIADAFLKGIQPISGNQLLDAMIATSKFDELGKHAFRKKGFISSGEEPESVSKTLEYAYDDFCIAQMAKEIGRRDVYQEYLKSSFNFINSFDESSKFMRPRKGAVWHSPFDPAEVNFNSTEANSWQYSLYAPHAMDVLSEYLGGPDSLEVWLDRLFNAKAELSGRHQVDITGLIGQYAHGNEPSHHMAYLYNYTSKNYKTQDIVDRIQKEMYSTKPDGLSGNEDCGQMSSWYVLSALGFYQVSPAYPFYDFGRPLFDSVALNLENGNKLKLIAKDNSPSNKYIQEVLWNGKTWNQNQIAHAEIMNGGVLEFRMGSAPARTDVPRSTSAIGMKHLDSTRFVASPYVLNTQTIFDDNMYVELGKHSLVAGEDVSLQYRFLSDTNAIHQYSERFLIDTSTIIEIRRVEGFNLGKKGGIPIVISHYSPWVSAHFVKKQQGLHLSLQTEFSPQYPASGPESLVDGLQGENEFRTGDYQGFWAQDVVGIVHFDEPRTISKIGVSALQDMKSWIFYPKSVHFEVSIDGVNFTQAGTFSDFPNFSDYVGPTHMDALVDLEQTIAVKAIRFKVENFGTCPTWHLGAGNDTWLFLDEIIFE